jgi:hypothetical protein
MGFGRVLHWDSGIASPALLLGVFCIFGLRKPGAIFEKFKKISRIFLNSVF